MQQRFTILVVLFSLMLACLRVGQAFEDNSLATSAEAYRQQIAKRAVPADFSKAQALRRALNYSQQELWREAIDQHERLLAAGETEELIWLSLSEAWEKAAQAKRQHRQRALQASYLAYLNATSERHQALALFRLGRLYADSNRARNALAAWREGLGLVEDQDIARRYRQLADSQMFQVRGVEVESEDSDPRICLRFSDDLQQTKPPVWSDYVQLEPRVETEISAQGRRLCISGVEHGTEYQLTLKPGVPADSGSRTESGETFTARVDDRPATLGFRGNDYVLPRAGQQDLPLTSVNVSQANIEVLRINERNLVNPLNERELYTLLSGYQARQIAQRSGESVWQGELSIAKELNQEVTTAIPISQIISDPQPGIYIVTAHDAAQEDYHWDDRATQWLVVSDLGLSTYRGADGLHVFVRSLDSAQAIAGVALQLVARNNAELGTAITDGTGHARFEPGLLRGAGGARPALLLASLPTTNGVDFSFLDLTRPAFDLSDRGVAGRPAPGPLDAFLYSERGVYRPGETVELMTLLRDSRGFQAAQSLPLTLSLVRPDQVEIERLTLSHDHAGAYHTRLPIPANAYTGNWQARVYADPDADPIGSLDFLVEDFVPQQLKLELSADSELLRPGQDATVMLQGDYLYGAPGSNLRTDAELVLREDPEPFPDYAGFHFGRVEESFKSQRFTLEAPTTDAAGRAQIALRLDEQPDTSRPLQAQVRVTLFEPGGRPVNQTLALPYRLNAVNLGIKKGFKNDLAPGQEAAFELIALDSEGQSRDLAEANIELVRENHEYYWYSTDGRWDYRLIIRDSVPLDSHSIRLSAAAPRPLRFSGLDWGSYRLDVHDPTSGASSSLRFNVGWYSAPSEDDAPDKLRITLDQPSYRSGDTAQIRIEAPFAGKVLLNVASDKLWQTLSLDLPATADKTGATTLDLPVSADWTPGVYLTATAYRPGQGLTDAQAHQRGPGRAVGVTWLGLDRAPRTLSLKLDIPTEVQPRQRIDVPVQLDGITPGQTAFVTLAAVDEGILQLTDFESPAPLDYFLGKRRLGVDLLDLYGKLIASGGQRGALRSGAGAASRNLNSSGVKTVRTVALFSGPLAVGSDGQIRVPLELPDFNGQLRLMAVAWDATRLGQAEQTLLVRDPLVTQVYLPRFLAPGDQADLTLNVQNLSAASGVYRIRLDASGAVSLPQAAALDLLIGDPALSLSQQQSFRLQAGEAGIGQIALSVEGPNGFKLLRDWAIPVRPAQTYITDRQTQQLAPGETLALNQQSLAGLLKPELQLSVASTPPFNVPALLRQLDRYPYGCLEQTTSRALPLLYLTATGAAYSGQNSNDDTVRNRVQQAIQRVLALQHYEGGFGLWNQDSPTETWLSAYALEFLVRARTLDYLVPENPYQRGLEWLQEQLNNADYDNFDALANRAYMLYVLALAQQAPLGELRYLHDNHLDRLPTRLARAQLGAALALYGDTARSQAAFAAAEKPGFGDLNRIFDYGSELRDQAAWVALQAESGTPPAQLAEAAARLAAQFQERTYTSTQEQAWLLLAAHALIQDNQTAKGLNLAVTGQTIGTAQDPFYFNPDASALERGISITNIGTESAWYVLSRSGIPNTPQPSANEGLRLERRYFNSDGTPLTGNELVQNERIVVRIDGVIDSREPHQLLVVDLLPAGLELENARLGDGDSLANYPWLDELSYPDHVELRDDRYVAAIQLSSRQRKFSLAYLARAVTPGDFVQPAVFAEDMYKPWYFGRGDMARLTVR